VVIDGQQSEFIVKSGVSQGTALGLSCSIYHAVMAFPQIHNCVIVFYIKEKHDQGVLQANINQLIKWSKNW